VQKKKTIQFLNSALPCLFTSTLSSSRNYTLYTSLGPLI